MRRLAECERDSDVLLADNVHDPAAIRADVDARSIKTVFPLGSNRLVMIEDDRTFLKQRNHLGRMFGQLKIIRVIATRDGKTAET